MPVLASQTRAVLSSDPEMTFDPSGENATDVTISSCRKGGSILAPVLAPQTRMVLSYNPETILDPSGENAMEVTAQLVMGTAWLGLEAGA